MNLIKAERNAAKTQTENEDLVSNSTELNSQEKPYVEVISDVRENHAGTEDSPLKKLHSEGTRINRSRHYIETPEAEPVSAEEAIFGNEEAPEPKKTEKNDNNRYSANRRF